MEAGLVALKFEAIFSVFVAILWSLTMWWSRRAKARKAGQRTESTLETVLRQLFWAVVFLGIGALGYAFNNLDITASGFNAGMTMIILAFIAGAFSFMSKKTPSRGLNRTK